MKSKVKVQCLTCKDREEIIIKKPSFYSHTVATVNCKKCGSKSMLKFRKSAGQDNAVQVMMLEFTPGVIKEEVEATP